MKKINTTTINEIKEAFQVSSDNDIHAAFFDLSSNFYNITNDELSQVPSPKADEVIINIGGAFGEFDASRIPWDAENRTMLPGTALWGVVSQQATAALFNKVNDANQMGDITSLPFNPETNKFSYESPLFMTSASTEAEKQRLEAAEQVTNLAYPILGEAMARGELIGALAHGAGAVGKVVNVVTKPLQMLAKLLDRVLLGGATQRAAAAGLVITGVAAKSVGKYAMKSLAKVGIKTGEAAAEAAAKRAAAKASERAATKAGAQEVTKLTAKMAGKIMGKFVFKMIQGAAITMVSLSAIPFIGPQLDAMYMVIVMPLMMALQMGGVIDGALTKLGDPEGCCPQGSIPLDILIPDWAQMIVSNIPVLGDILSCFFPYMCSVSGSGALVYKKTLTLPKWMQYGWLSCYYLEWPDYNCRIGASVMNGKTLTGSVYSWNNEGRGLYTKLSDVAAYPDNYVQTNRRMINGHTDDTQKQRIIPQGQKFFYADFSEPRMLIDMGKFYYNWAIKNPYPNDDGTVTVEYISKINYVIASSLYTCDALCEMTSVTFNPITGEGFSETITYDRDRRFYYACDNNVNAPPHWEDNVANWRTLDDAYDLAVNDLNSFIHQSQFNNTELDVSVLQTAYTQMLDASNRYVFISNITMNNLSNEIVSLSNNSIPISSLPTLVGNDENVKDFYNGYINASNNIQTVISKNLYNGASAGNKPQLLNKLNTIHIASNAIYNYRYTNTASPSYYTNTTLINNQYKLVGCTYVDDTASSAANPDPTNLEPESRYPCNFDVKPYLIRCGGVNMSISKCIDASNVELVIYNYLLQNPTKRIKTINSIKAKGTNCCEFVWDEITIDPATRTETNLKTNVNTQVLYQQDLSSCTFNLPPPTLIGSTSNYLFGSQTRCTAPISSPPTTLKMFKKSVNSTDANYENYTTLAYKQAKFKYPQFTPPNTMPTSFVESNIDYVSRYDPTNFTRMVDLVRPRKPIRIFYPGEDEKTLGNYSNNYCSDPAMLQRFLLSYNGNSNNVNKITTIIRSFTSSSNTCDMEVDTIEPSTNHLKRVTMTMNMTEGFQSSGSNAHPFRYQSVNSQGDGLYIDKNTDSLSNPYQDGVSFGDPYLRSFQSEVVPFTSYFNDDLIKNFTTKTKSLRDNTNRLLVGLTGTRHLGGPSCSTKCQDGEVVQRIIEQYNKDGAASTRFGAEQNSVLQVLNSATNSSNTCHILVENKKEFYGDLYIGNTGSNYDTENRLVFKEVEMADAGNCRFYPVPNQIYQDISASDLALSSSSNFNTYITPKRIGCPPVHCGDSALYGPAMRDYINQTGNPITQSNKYIAIGPNKCDYLIKTDITLSDNSMLSDLDDSILDQDFVLRVSYDAPLYLNSSTTHCDQDSSYTYSYNTNNFVLQTPEDLSEYVNTPEYYQTVDSNSTYTSPLSGAIDDMPSFVHNL